MAKIIMVQGTSSGVGKSIVTTALCRIFKQMGYSVAPFKSQNMSSNFHTLENGDKMARSQAIAAYACGIKPSSDMNPILLMPKTDGNVEVVLCGKTFDSMNGFGYNDYKKLAFDSALTSFKKLNDTYDIVVIEGAGSPVEMNLIKNDIVNMGLAEAINAPVLLVSDINRGGVFASLYGTINLFTKEQRNLVKGIIINKFMGDISYFSDGKKIIEDLCEKPVVGIIPYTNINVEDEDNLTDFGCSIKTRESLTGNLEDNDTSNYLKFLDNEFDKLAEHFKANLDIEKILSDM